MGSSWFFTMDTKQKTVKLAVLVIQLNWSVLVTKIVFKLTPNNWNLTPTKFSTQVNSRNSDFIWIFELSITKIWFHVKSEQHKKFLILNRTKPKLYKFQSWGWFWGLWTDLWRLNRKSPFNEYNLLLIKNALFYLV